MDGLITVGQILLAGLGTLFFGISLSVEKNDLPYVALIGAICFSANKFFSMAFSSLILGTFMAALTVSLLSIFLSKQRQKPMAVFLASGIVPILPGYSIFKMVLGFIEQNNNDIVIYETIALQKLVIIAVGVVIASSVSKIINYVISKRIS